ncbi:VWA domain-containing protein [Streptomyces sp. MBT65]|nr:VWA domain-containing protein [Streptomyces sp. MBT65]
MEKMDNQYAGNLEYAVDIVMCIDATGSMGSTLQQVKENALSFHKRLNEEMAQKGKVISHLRIKVIAFRDFGDRADDAIQQTDFLLLPGQQTEFETFVKGLRATGGGDAPESGLEALALALQSPWEKGLDRQRHVVVVFTDAPAHPLGDPRQTSASTYPASVPRSIDDLYEQWGHSASQSALMDNSAKRLLVFAPETPPWTNIGDDWNQSIFFPSRAGEGLEEYEMTEIINSIANSIG